MKKHFWHYGNISNTVPQGAVLLPRAIIASILLYLGCRWLAASPSFEDLLLNAVRGPRMSGTDTALAGLFVECVRLQRRRCWPW